MATGHQDRAPTLSEQTSHIQETVEALREQFKALIESIKQWQWQ